MRNDELDRDFYCEAEDYSLIDRIRASVLAPFKFVKDTLRGPEGIPGKQGPMGLAGRDGKDGSDICCPRCNSWYSELPAHLKPMFFLPSKNPKYAHDKNFITMSCSCGHDSDWFTGAPMFIPASDVVITKPLTEYQKRQNARTKRRAK